MDYMDIDVRCSQKKAVKLNHSLTQGHAGQKIAIFYPNWAFPDCNSSLNSPMDLKWCTEFDVI